MFAPDPEKVTVTRSPERDHRYRAKGGLCLTQAIAGLHSHLVFAELCGPVSPTPSPLYGVGALLFRIQHGVP
jgi:hypothetical protein